MAVGRAAMNGVGRYRQRGAAVLTALLLVSAAVAAVVPNSVGERVAVARTAKLADLAQLRLMARGVERWAGMMLERDGKNSLLDHTGESWNRKVDNIPAEGGTASGHITDEQGRFNLNDLMSDGRPDPLQVERFRRLLEKLDLNPALSDAVIDWIDKDELVRVPGGAESATYLAKQQPYRAANAPMTMTSELLLIEGFSQASYVVLEPYISALPFRASINVNTASATVLRAIIPSIDESGLRQFLAERHYAPIESLDELRAHPLFSVEGIELDGLGTGSDWFRVEATLNLRRARLEHKALLLRSDDATRVWQRWSGG